MNAAEALAAVHELRTAAGVFDSKPLADRPCPPQPESIECPRGCGFLTSPRPSAQWGPWRMQVHLMNDRCPRYIPSVSGTYRRGRAATR